MPEDELSTGLKLLLTQQQVEELWGLEDAARRDRLQECLQITDAAHNFRSEVIVDFHYYNLMHGQAICLSAFKTAVFVAIMAEVLASLPRKSPTSDTHGEPYTCPDCFREYKRLILLHALDRPPEQVLVFVSSEVRLLTDFVNLTLMKHFHLYQYCLLYNREVDTVRIEVSLEEPFCTPPSLEHAKLKEEPVDHGLAGVGAPQPDGPAATVYDTLQQAGAADFAEGGDVLDNLIDQNLKGEVRQLIEAKMGALSKDLEERLDKRQRQLETRIASIKTA